jgi:hypothetical protein
MDARLSRVAVLAAAFFSLGIQNAVANYPTHQAIAVGPRQSCRSQNFIVSAPTPDFARKVCETAERYRKELAMEWLGRELAPWESPCPIQVQVGPHLGAGGATSFVFRGGHPSDWTMTIQGSRERLLDSVLPHEVTHTIFATHFGRPLPRWADEGACTTVEHASERGKQHQLLIQFLKTDRGIAFNQMFAMREYPSDILPLYAQGFSLARFLIAQGGKPKFVKYVGDGMRSNNWPQATKKHYGYANLSVLQVTWLDWVRTGSSLDAIKSPLGSPSTMFASTGQSRGSITTVPQSAGQLAPLPNKGQPNRNVAPPNQVAQADARQATSEGWYVRQRNRALQNNPADPSADKTTRIAPLSYQREVQQMDQNGVILEWHRPPQGTTARPGSTVMR